MLPFRDYRMAIRSDFFQRVCLDAGAVQAILRDPTAPDEEDMPKPLSLIPTTLTTAQAAVRRIASASVNRTWPTIP